MVRDSNLESKSGRLYYGWVVVATGFTIWTTIFGIQYAFGIFFKPLQEAFGWSRAATSGAMTVHLLVFAVCMVPAGWALDRINPRLLFSIAAVLVGSSLALCSRISEAWQFYLLYGLPLAVGFSICGPAIAAMTTRWFTEKRGLALGITSAGVGFGTLIGAPVSNTLIAAYGWRTAFLALGIAGFAILMVCTYFIRKAPPIVGDERPLARSGNGSGPPQPLAPRGKTFAQVIRTREMLLILIAQLFTLFAHRMIMVHIVPHAIDMGISDSAAALSMGIIGGVGVIGRLTMGLAQDKIGAQRSMIICLVIEGVALLALPFIGADLLLFVFAAVFGFTYGGDVPQVPAIVARCFGLTSIGVTYALAVSAGNLGGALGPIIGGYVFDRTGGYTAVFLGAGASLFLAALCIWRLRLHD